MKAAVQNGSDGAEEVSLWKVYQKEKKITLGSFFKDWCVYIW